MRALRFLIGDGVAVAFLYPGDVQPILDSVALARKIRFLPIAVLTAAALANGDLLLAERRTGFFELGVCILFLDCLLDLPR